jgi:hypothetical protein
MCGSGEMSIFRSMPGVVMPLETVVCRTGGSGLFGTRVSTLECWAESVPRIPGIVLTVTVTR